MVRKSREEGQQRKAARTVKARGSEAGTGSQGIERELVRCSAPVREQRGQEQRRLDRTPRGAGRVKDGPESSDWIFYRIFHWLFSLEIIAESASK